MILYFVILILGLIVRINAASYFSDIAEAKGYSRKFWFCFCFGIIGYFYVYSLPDLVARENAEKLVNIQEQILQELQKSGKKEN